MLSSDILIAILCKLQIDLYRARNLTPRRRVAGHEKHSLLYILRQTFRLMVSLADKRHNQVISIPHPENDTRVDSFLLQLDCQINGAIQIQADACLRTTAKTSFPQDPLHTQM